MKTIPFFFGVLFLFLQSTIGQNPGDLDTSFSDNGYDFYNTDNNTDDFGNEVIIQPDGKILSIGESNDFSIVRYLPNGENDNSYGNNSQLLIPIGFTSSNGAFGAVQQDDGKVILIGQGRPGQGDFGFALVRINPNGTIDNSFGTSGFVFTNFEGQDSGRDLALQSDGKIVAVGSAKTPTTAPNTAIARYLPNGVLDDSFGNDGKILLPISPTSLDSAVSLVIQSDNKIVVGGYATVNGEVAISVLRFNTDGSFDTSFGNDGMVFIQSSQYNAAIEKVIIQNNGKLVIAGRKIDNFNTDLFLVRLRTDGTLDTTFGQDGVVIDDLTSGYDSIYDIILQPDGKFVVGGSAGDDFLIARYNANGTRDNSFGTSGYVTTVIGEALCSAGALAFQTDGKIVMVGDCFTPVGTFTLVTARYHRGLLSVEDFNKRQTVSLYPNPIETSGFLDFQGKWDTPVSASIYDMYGRKIKDLLVNELLSEERYQLPLNVNNLATGNYFIQVMSKNSNAALKFIKQ